MISLLLALSLAQDRKPSPLVGPIEHLWPEGAPHQAGDGERDKPSLSLYLAKEDGPRPTVVVCPGGGYGGLAKDHEGHQFGVWFNERGVNALILSYRHAPAYRAPVPLLDVQRAIRTARARAVEWNVDPAKVGVMGFSAGGHLASTALTRFDAGKADAEDPVERAGCRPDFGVLCYPVISFGEAWTHKGSQKNLLGEKDGDAELIRFYSAEKQVTEKTPPCFLFHTTTDQPVPPENSIVFYQALRKSKVPAELHIYEKGPHGVGLAKSDPALSSWPERLDGWLRTRGILPKR